MDDFSLDYLDSEEKALVVKMLDAVVNFDDVHLNRFLVSRRGVKLAYFVGQRGGGGSPFPQYSLLDRNITSQLLYYGAIRSATATDAPRGWFEFTDRAIEWFSMQAKLSSDEKTKEMTLIQRSTPDPRSVFVVHGRNNAARDGMFTFLRAIGLSPMEWSQAVALTNEGSPYIGQVLDRAFAAAQAIVVLMTPDEIAYLRPEYTSDEVDTDLTPTPQSRPNVLFEAGLAFGRNSTRTILVELGTLRPFSDIGGRHVLRLNNSLAKRNDLAQRLITAGCKVDLSGNDWHTAGSLEPPASWQRPSP